MLKKAAITLLGVVAVVAMAGCAGSVSEAPSAAVRGPADVGGRWVGGLVLGGAPVTMVLEQDGTSVKGDLRVTGRADLSGPIEGTVDEKSITLQTHSGFASAPRLSVHGDQITGSVGGDALDVYRRR
jgi:hypothetical protein